MIFNLTVHKTTSIKDSSSCLLVEFFALAVRLAYYGSTAILLYSFCWHDVHRVAFDLFWLLSFKMCVSKLQVSRSSDLFICHRHDLTTTYAYVKKFLWRACGDYDIDWCTSGGAQEIEKRLQASCQLPRCACIAVLKLLHPKLKKANLYKWYSTFWPRATLLPYELYKHAFLVPPVAELLAHVSLLTRQEEKTV